MRGEIGEAELLQMEAEIEAELREFAAGGRACVHASCGRGECAYAAGKAFLLKPCGRCGRVFKSTPAPSAPEPVFCPTCGGGR